MQRKWIWASLSIVVMWLSVLFAALFGPVLTTEEVTGVVTEVPVLGLTISLFALIGTIVVAIAGFKGDAGSPVPSATEMHVATLEAEIARLKEEVAKLSVPPAPKEEHPIEVARG